MNKKHTYHKPQPHYVRVQFDGAHLESPYYPSKAAAQRAVEQYRARYPLNRITVEKVNG